MPINFIPRRGAILICDFDMAGVWPEMTKRRRVVVVSSQDFNRLHANGPGLCQVVPLSATRPSPLDKRSHFIPAGRYRSITRDVWAKAGMVTTVSHARLDRVFYARERRYLGEDVTRADLDGIEASVRFALGLDVDPT